MREQVQILSPQELAEVRALLRRSKIVPRIGDTPQPTDMLWTPETYLALTPSAGIPGLSTETGTGSPDVLASAECTIYRLDAEGTLVEMHRRQTVYNVTGANIPGDTHVVVTRLKERDWVAITESGGARIYIAKVPSGQNLPAMSSTCETGTGPGGLFPDPVDCQVYERNGYRLEPVPGLTKPVFNLGPQDVPACSIIPIWQDAYGNWFTDWFEAGSGTTGVTTCNELAYTCTNGSLVAYHTCDEDELVISSVTGTCCSGGTTGGSGFGTTCGTASFTITFGTGKQVDGDGTDLTSTCAPLSSIQTACVTGPYTYDCGDGITGEYWTGIGPDGATIKLIKCGDIWKLSGGGVSSACQGVSADPDPCTAWSTTSVGCQYVVDGVAYPFTIDVGACTWNCWVNNTTYVSDCFNADPGGSTLVSGPYPTEAACTEVCGAWFCMTYTGTVQGDELYRFCTNVPTQPNVTLVSGPYAGESACGLVCEEYYCMETFACDDAACSVNCESTPYPDGRPNPQCGTVSVVDQPLGSGFGYCSTPLDVPAGKLSVYVDLLNVYTTLEECQLSCV